MLHRTSQYKIQLAQMADVLIIAASFTLTLAIRRQLTRWNPGLFPPFDALWQHAWLYILAVPLWIFLLDLCGFYQHSFARSPIATLKILVRANLLGIVFAFFILYVLKVKHIPRVLLPIFGALNVGLLGGKEMVLHRLAPFWNSPANLVLIGMPDELEPAMQRLSKLPPWLARPLGLLLYSGQTSPTSAEGRSSLPVLGTVDDLVKVLHEYSVDSVILAPGGQAFDEIQKIIRLCETEGVEVWMIADFIRTSIARAHVDEFQDLPVLVFSSTPSMSWALVCKRVMDFIGSVLLLVLCAPLMLAIAVAIKLTSPGPVLFRQRRCTLHGRTFTMYKFRTMVANAEEQRQLLEAYNEVSGPVFKIREDPRVTPIGRFLRRHSLDELPQLFNVLAGDMSLVGPRPPLPAEVVRYENWQRRRLSMRPGITCLWQVSGRNDLPFEDWMRLDLEYIDRWSLVLDLKILLKTPLAVIRGTGY